MTVILHAIHTIRPISGPVFDRWVDIYGNAIIPAMKRNGFDVIGAFKRSTGRMQQDLLLIRFESVADYEKASLSLRRDAAMAKDVGTLMTGIEVEEEITVANTVPYATEARLEKVLAEKPEKPRQYMQATLQVKLGGQMVAYEQIGKIADLVEQSGFMGLATAYDALTGLRGTLNDIWVLNRGMSDLSYRPSGAGLGELETKLREVAPEEELTYINPLPYSPLQ